MFPQALCCQGVPDEVHGSNTQVKLLFFLIQLATDNIRHLLTGVDGEWLELSSRVFIDIDFSDDLHQSNGSFDVQPLDLLTHRGHADQTPVLSKKYPIQQSDHLNGFSRVKVLGHHYQSGQVKPVFVEALARFREHEGILQDSVHDGVDG